MKRLFLMGFFALSCSGSGKGYYSESNLPVVKIATNTNESDIVFRIYDRDFKNLVRESKGDGWIQVEIPEGWYCFSAWKDKNNNNRIDTGDLYGADSSAKNISWGCIPCEVNISLSVVGR